MDYGLRIKELRSNQGISARSLALSSNLDPSQISKIENGTSKPSLDALERICAVLKIPLSDFFNDQQLLSPTMQRLIDAGRHFDDKELEYLTKFLELSSANR